MSTEVHPASDARERFREDTRTPSPRPPANSCDCQVHVFGDPAKYPLRAAKAYEPYPDATIEAAQKMHRALGIDRGVVVQATAHGTDHRILFDALAGRPNYRGVAIIDDDVTDDEIRRLHAAGVRGARFNFWKALNIAPTTESFLRSVKRISEYGWHAKIHSVEEDWLGLVDLLGSLDTPIVIDHLGHLHVETSTNGAPFRALQSLVQRDNVWILVSNADRVSNMPSPWNDALPVAQAFVKAAPDRAIWCTDWPHVRYDKPMPNDAELLEFLYCAVPDEALRKKILVDNAARLFDFPA